jgi:hypothetical protein
VVFWFERHRPVRIAPVVRLLAEIVRDERKAREKNSSERKDPMKTKKSSKAKGKTAKGAAVASANPDEMRRRERRPVLVKLGDHEIAGFAKDYVSTRTKLYLLQLDLKKARDQFKDDSKLLEEGASQLLAWIKAEAKEVEMDVDVVYDWAHNEVRVERADNHETVASRTMTREEAQRELFDVEGKPELDRHEVRDAKPGEETGAGALTATLGEISEAAHGNEGTSEEGTPPPAAEDEGLAF